MPVVAVINRKGGSGKSTLATHIAAQAARSGAAVMLGDVDRQQSSLSWLRRRAAQPAAAGAHIAGWAVDPASVMRPPAGVTHVVLDTPGGLHGMALARAVMTADVVLVPLCASAFDRESAEACVAELRALPRVAAGRCSVGLVGMRLDARTRAAAELRSWAEDRGHTYVGGLREAQVYVRAAELGLTLFDLPAAKVAADLEQWQPIVTWLQAALAESAVAERSARAPQRPLDRPSRPAPLAAPLARELQPDPMRKLPLPPARSTGLLQGWFGRFLRA
jgi:chromosome partitioning protein